jgi:hypothetical protein
VKTVFLCEHRGLGHPPPSVLPKDFVTVGPETAWRDYPSQRLSQRTREFIELTPRVRLGLWLAEDDDREWLHYDRALQSDVLVELTSLEKGERHIGTGPTLDAAIEDALAKLAAKGER